MTRKAIVTGGAGFVGSHLVDLLVDNDWDVLVLDDLSSGKMEHLAEARRRAKIGIHITDIRAPELGDVVSRFQPEVVFHLAAQSKVRPSVDDPVHDAEINVVGTIGLLAAAAAAGTRVHVDDRQGVVGEHPAVHGQGRVPVAGGGSQDDGAVVCEAVGRRQGCAAEGAAALDEEGLAGGDVPSVAGGARHPEGGRRAGRGVPARIERWLDCRSPPPHPPRRSRAVP